MNIIKIIKFCFNVACFATAFGMTVLWVYRFHQDEDLCQVDMKQFDMLPEEEYPMLSFCFWDSILESKLKSFNLTTLESYLDIMTRKKSFGPFDKFDLNDISFDLADYYLNDAIEFRNGTSIERWSPPFLNEMPRVTHSEFWNFGEIGYGKCFGLRSSYKNAAYVTYGLNTSIFTLKKRDYKMFAVYTHLPNKFLVAGNSKKTTWPKRQNGTYLQLEFQLHQIEIIKRRNKPSSPCVSDKFNYDEGVVNDQVEKVGCKAPNQKTNEKRKTCDSLEKLINVSSIIEVKNSKIACTSTGTISFTYNEYYDDMYDPNRLDINIYFPGIYKEISMVKAVDIQTAIGNAGGYIGLFLGNMF